MDSSHIQFSARKLLLSQPQALFKLGAFWAKDRSVEDLSIAIANSEPISVWDGERLIGFASNIRWHLPRQYLDVVPPGLSRRWPRAQVGRNSLKSSP